MPASLSNLTTNHARIVRTFDDGSSIFIDYKPLSVTPRQFHRLQTLRNQVWEDLSADEQTEAVDTTTRLLASCLIAWDFVDEQGQPIPATLEGLQDVSYEHQTLLLDMIQQDQQLPKVNGIGKLPASISGTSTSPLTDPADSSPRALNGTPSASLPSGGI